MTRRAKYSKPMREVRTRIARLFQEARKALRSGACLRASALYNEALGIAHRKGITTKSATTYRMKSALRRCRREHGWDRA